MWTYAASIPDSYLVAIIGAGLPAALLVAAWVFNRIGNHERDIAVLKEKDDVRRHDIADLENQVRDLERGRR